MSIYNDEFKKINLGFDEIENVSSGVASVNLSDACHKESGVFSLIENKANKWKQSGCPKTCEFCWNLKYDNGFFCDA
ncbi:MAG: hypothetical protein RUMPE_00518 [Eubacteriales bacterium SKADARSKE-1]|nr:hypothetical protein [Eubacteriales bacterium SKADARSKE-1]